MQGASVSIVTSAAARSRCWQHSMSSALWRGRVAEAAAADQAQPGDLAGIDQKVSRHAQFAP
jgi:hypothetical protein